MSKDDILFRRTKVCAQKDCNIACYKFTYNYEMGHLKVVYILCKDENVKILQLVRLHFNNRTFEEFYGFVSTTNFRYN
jgi:hypothetical protein